MPEYLLTGVDPAGRTVTERVEAESADQAVHTLRDRGHTDIVLHTDDVGARYSQQARVAAHVSPREYVAFRHFRGYWDHVFFLTRKIYRGWWPVFVLAIAGIVARRWLNLSRELEITCWVLLAFPLVLALIGRLTSPGRAYERIIEAHAWGRWDEVVRLLPTIKGKVPPHESAFREAQALAGLDRLEEALDIVEPFADGTEIPTWIFHARLVEVYHLAGKLDQIVPSIEKAAELAPDNATILIDLASALLRFRRDVVRARSILARARTHALSDMVEPFALLAEGMLLLDEGKAPAAQERFEQALAGMMNFRHANALMGAVIDRVYTYLSLAHAAQGNTADALEYFHRAEPRLRALRMNDLLARCQSALGQLGGTP